VNLNSQTPLHEVQGFLYYSAKNLALHEFRNGCKGCN